MERFISLSLAQVKMLACEMDMTVAQVRHRLNYSNDSVAAYKVRRKAKEMGGVTMLTAPECETIHDSNGVMRQYFDNGAQVMVDKRVGRVVLIDPKGDIRIKINSGCSVRELMLIQQEAEKMKRSDEE